MARTTRWTMRGGLTALVFAGLLATLLAPRHAAAAGVLHASPSGAIDFGGTPHGVPLTHTVTYSNTGTQPLSLALKSTLSGDPAFSVSGGSCLGALQIAAGASCTVDLTFDAATLGHATATYTFRTDAGNAVHQLDATAAPDGSWTAVGNLPIGVRGATLTALSNTTALLAGGGGTPNRDKAYLFDINTGAWTPTNDLIGERQFHSATPLKSGNILVAGGATVGAPQLDTAEVYHPATGVWTPAGPLQSPRISHAVTRLLDGRVLVAGGYSTSHEATPTEIYDPATNTWTQSGYLLIHREAPRGVTLTDGRVLVAGGLSVVGGSYFTEPSAEVYDPATGIWSFTGSMTTGRAGHAMVVLEDGRVIAIGGMDGNSQFLDSAEIYDPATGVWTLVGNMEIARHGAEALLLPSGDVFVTGGKACFTCTTSRTAIFRTALGIWTPGPWLNLPRSLHAVTLMRGGYVLVAGGDAVVGTGGLKEAELYSPMTPFCTPGSYSATGTEPCMPASPGHYVAVNAATTQTACSPGSYQPGVGRPSCLPAPAGSYVAGSGAIASTLCSMGTFTATAGATSCTPAAPGSYVPVSGATAQTPCSPGTYSTLPASIICTQAPVGSYVPDSGATAPTPAPPGSYVPAKGASAATPCAPGSYSANSGAIGCAPAAPGFFVAVAGATHPDACEAGTYQPGTGATDCIPAAVDTYVPTPGAVAATPCPPGLTTNGLTGQVVCVQPVATGGLQASPTSLALGPIVRGSTPSPAQSVTFTNSGGTPLAVTAIPVVGAQFSITGGSCAVGLALAPGATCDVSLVFTSTVIGTFSGTLSLVTDGATADVALTGVATEPAFTYGPAPVIFAPEQVGTVSPSHTVRFNNNGTAPFTITSIALSSSPAGIPSAVPFALAVETTCAAGQAIAGGTNCEVAVTFAPTAPALVTSYLVVKTSIGKTAVIPLTGLGTAGAPAPSAVACCTVPNPAGGTSNLQLLLMQAPGGTAVGSLPSYVFQVNGENYLFRATAIDPNGLVISGSTATIAARGILMKLGAPNVTLPGTHAIRIDLDGAADTVHVAVVTPSGAVFHELDAAGASLPIGGGDIIVQ